MARARATLKVTTGPNEGDSVSVEVGSCRLIGRHLSDSETSFIDRDGNRVLEMDAAQLLEKHLKDRAPQMSTTAGDFRASAFERGADIILGDDSISRAHAMVFFDQSGFGIIDLASTNGTFVNRERVGTALVASGDVIAIGNSELSVQIGR
ncbi:MAG: FHA domain-containing protein [Deltaproteobacteria bacterium]|nr:FHA domain-containing protein [Deltaproteobacteria bacterium]